MEPLCADHPAAELDAPPQTHLPGLPQMFITVLEVDGAFVAHTTIGSHPPPFDDQVGRYIFHHQRPTNGRADQAQRDIRSAICRTARDRGIRHIRHIGTIPSA